MSADGTIPEARKKTERVPLDFYATPRENTRQIFRWLFGAPPFGGGSFTVLDPSCGDGEILEAVGEWGASGIGIELDPGRAAIADYRGNIVAVGDALIVDWPKADALIGNPPFSLAQEFAEKAARWAAIWRRPAALLLRLAFLESVQRYDFHARYPSDVYVLSKRPSFTGGGTDSCAYAWFVWGDQRCATCVGPRVKVLPPVETPRRRK